MLRRDAIKDFNFAPYAAVFSEMAQSAEADQLRIIFESDRPETEALIYEAFNTAFDNRDGRLTRNDLIVPQEIPHTRINPKTMQIISVAHCERTHHQPRSSYHRKTIGHKPITTLTMLFGVTPKSKPATLGRRYSTTRVSKRLIDESAACLRARYCTNLDCSDLNKRQKI